MNASLAQCGRPSVWQEELQRTVHLVMYQTATLVLLLTRCHLLVGAGEAANSSLDSLTFSLIAFQFSFQFSPLLARWLTLYVLLKRSKYIHDHFSQFLSHCDSQSGVSRPFWRKPFRAHCWRWSCTGFGRFWWLHFLRRVGPVSSVRSSSTERDDQRMTWTCQRL